MKTSDLVEDLEDELENFQNECKELIDQKDKLSDRIKELEAERGYCQKCGDLIKLQQ